MDFDPGHRKLRQFAALLLFVCGVISAMVWMRTGSIEEPASLLLAVGIVWSVAGIARPAAMRFLFVALTVALFPVGWLVSRLVLAVIYYLVLTPVGLILRLTKHDPLGLDRGGRDTFWKTVEPRTDPSSYFRQF